MTEQSPQDVMSEAAAAPKGIVIAFENKTAALKFRTRCYTIRSRAEAANAKAAEKAGIPPEDTGWEGLAFHPKDNTLWIGTPTNETYGIVSIEEVTE